MIQVVNKRSYRQTGERHEVYIGRPSPLGNPFTVREHGREGCIEKYGVWLRRELNTNPEVKREMNRLYWLYKREGKLTLICWCAPLACHGDVLKQIFEEMYRWEANNPSAVTTVFTDREKWPF